MKEIVLVLLVIYYISQYVELASPNDKSIEKNGPSKIEITENNERTFYMGHRRPLYFDRKQRVEKYKFPYQIRRLNTKFDKPKMGGGIISKKHALPAARNRKNKMNRFPLVKAAPFSMACDVDLDWRIVDGSKAAEGQFPYQVSLRIINKHECGGSILNAQWVLTAAHCVVDKSRRCMTVVTGTSSLLSGGDSYKVARAIAHSGFDWDIMRNDIALLKIKGTIAFNAKVQPIPLETSYVGAGEELVLSGWGRTVPHIGDLSDDLQFLALKAISTKECKERNDDPSDSMAVDDTQLCTFTQFGQGACNGDSGGPLVHNGKVAGIDSYGTLCAFGYPDIFTRVSSFVDWINNHMHSLSPELE